MRIITRFWTRLRRYRVQFGLAFRVTVAALLALAIAQFFDLRLPLWAVMTAIVVTQVSVGRSLKAMINYLSGTLGGAVYATIVAVLVPHSNEIMLLLVLAIALAPLTLIAATNPSLNVAPITAAIVILVPAITHAGPVASAFDRVIEVALGGVIGCVVSFFIFPVNAHRLVIEAAARTLNQMARAFGELLAGLKHGLDIDSLHRIQDHIGQALAEMGTIGKEAERERSARLVLEADTRPLLSTLLRLRHDLVMIGRVTLVPLPESFWTRLQSPLDQIQAAMTNYLRRSSAALLAHRNPPLLDDVEAALVAYDAEVAALRADGLTRGLSDDDAQRFFTLGFALEQMHQNCRELEDCVTECARSPKPTDRITTG